MVFAQFGAGRHLFRLASGALAWRAVLVVLAMTLAGHAMGQEAMSPAEQRANAAQGAVVFAPDEVIPSVVERQFNPEDEWVHRWLQQIFGSFIFEPFGGPVDPGEITLLSYALGFTNVLGLFLGIVFVFNIYIVGAINTAHQGEVLGQKFSSIWVPVRAASGFMLIMPMQGVGGGVFSIIQMILMWVLIVSSNLASYLWENVADLMLDGKPVNVVPNDVTLAPSSELLKMMVCTEAHLQFQTRDEDGDTVYAKYQINTGPMPLSGKEKELSSGRALPGGYEYTRTIPEGAFSALKGQKISRISFADGECGAVTFPVGTSRADNGLPLEENLPILGDTFGNNYKKRMHERGTQAVADAILDQLEAMRVIAQSILYEQYDSQVSLPRGVLPLGGGTVVIQALEQKDDAPVADYRAVAEAFALGADRYARELPEVVQRAMLDDPELASQWKTDMVLGGWGGAGRWFMEMNSYVAMTHEVLNTGKTHIEFPGEVELCADFGVGFLRALFGDCSELEARYQDSIEVVDAMKALAIKEILPEKGLMRSVYLNSGFALCQSSLDCQGQSLNPLDAGFSDNIAMYVINLLGGYQNRDMTDARGIVNPFRAVSEFGHALNNWAAIAWAGARTAIHMATVFDGVKASSSIPIVSDIQALAAGNVEGILRAVIPPLMTFTIMMLSTGFVLAYLVPFMPLFVWINMVAGYLLTVVETIVASPLAVVQMITPEGEGISGTRLERFFQLVAFAVLKPSLMIIGLLASITLGAVIFGIYNTLFWSTAMMLLHDSIFNLVALIVLYVMGAFQLTKMSVLIMPKLPEQIMEWFASGVGRGFGENEVADTMGGAMQNMQGRLAEFGGAIRKGAGNPHKG